MTSPAALCDAYLAGRLVVCCGAGVAQAGGLPAWPALVGLLLAEASAAATDEDQPALARVRDAHARGDLVRALGELRRIVSSTAFGRTVARALDDGDRDVPELATAVAALAPTLHAALTTTLDRFLDRAFAGRWPSHTLAQMDLGQQRHYILKLHGDRTDRGSWVLTPREHQTLIDQRPELERFLAGVLRFHTLLFVGYHPRDPDLERLLAQIRGLAGAQAPQHFALVLAADADPYDRRTLAEAGLEPIVCTDVADVVQRLRALAAHQPGAGSTATPADPAPPRSTPPVPSPPTPTHRDDGTAPLRVLFLTANPRDTTRLALDEEMRAIEVAVRGASAVRPLDLVTRGAVRADDLLHHLNELRPQILHFSGHGSERGELMLSGEGGATHPVGPEALARLFALFRRDIQAVVLNACFSQIQAEAIAREIDHVIGMANEVGDEAACTFAASFYRALAYGRTLREAFDQGCIAVQLANLGEQHTPQFLTRGQGGA
jgi:hypothetical protein